jgi:hypothetical protein
MGITSVTLPGTLGVVSGFHNETVLTPWPSMNWSLPGLANDHVIEGPSATTIKVAMDAAYDMSILQIMPPHFNSSYTTRFHGPSLQCEAANATQIHIFDYYTQSLANQSAASLRPLIVTVTPSVVESPGFNATGELGPRTLEPLAFSAFAPNEGCTGWYEYLSSE